MSNNRRRAMLATMFCLPVMGVLKQIAPAVDEVYIASMPVVLFSAVELWLVALAITGWLNYSLFRILGMKDRRWHELF